MTSPNRWQLHRAGIANVYQYENDVLTFRGGRLLLRGVNGSGKSTAMNMLLPFLLTGKPRGIDAAGEQTGVLRSWMLSGREEKQPVGYLWLEFARSNSQVSGEEALETLTIGCGIKANRASDTVNTWWFVTQQRPGIDFEFVESQVPLSVDALRTVIAPDPVFMHDRRADYRHEVARRLYAGADIQPFLDLINTVRSPRVGDRVDLELPQYLVAALPNLSEQALLEAARPLDDLDEHRRNVGDLQTTAVGLDAVSTVYRNYVVNELHRELARAKVALSDVRRTRRELGAAQESHASAQEQQQLATVELTALEQKVRDCVAQIQTLERSSAYTEGQQLEDLRRHVASLQKRLQGDAATLEKLRERQPSLTMSVRRAEQETDEKFQQLAGELQQLAADASDANVDVAPVVVTQIPREALELKGLPAGERINEALETFDTSSLAAQLKALDAAASARQLDVVSAREQLKKVESAARTLGDAQSARSQSLESVEEATLRFEQGRHALSQARTQFVQSLEGWMQSARVQIAAEQPPSGFPAIEAVYLNTATVAADLAAARLDLFKGLENTCAQQQQVVAVLGTQADEARLIRDQAQQEVDRLNSLTEPDVPMLAWQQRNGLSLADLVDFRDQVTAPERAALEAAMEACGLLSATVTTSGEALVNGELLATAGAPAEHPLSKVLAPAIPQGCGIDQAQIMAVLDAINTNWSLQHHTTVTTDGRFVLGALSGRHHKSTAEFIGVTARRERLEKLRREAAAVLQQAAESLARLEADLTRARAFATALDTLRNTMPTLDAVEKAQAVATAREEELEQSRERLARMERAVNDAEKQLHAADEALHRLCRTQQLPVDAAGLQILEDTLKRINSATQLAHRSADAVARACRGWDEAVAALRIAQQDLQQALDQHESTERVYREHAARLDTLESTLGVEYRAVVEQIGKLEQQRGHSEQALPESQQRRDAAITRTQKRLNDVDNSRAALQTAEHACSTQQQHLKRVTEVRGLLETLATEPKPDAAGDASSPAAATAAAQNTADSDGLNALIRALQEHLPAKPAVETNADSVRQSLRQRRNTLGAGWDAEDEQPDSQLPMGIIVNGPLGQMPLAESLVAVHTQLSRLQALLTEKQDQALRNLLQGLIAREVAEKMFDARRLIDRMNDRLGSVTSSHGIGVRLRWRQSRDLEPAVAETVSILGKRPDLRTEAEEGTLREALASALEEERRLQPDAPYRLLISRVFDYRSWHQMDVLLRRADEAEKPLNRRTPLSEGEKKLVSYLPLFAAVAASCDALADSGADTVPRFLLLDDAFAKVSEDNHAPLFGLLVDLDLDFIATSERLWGTHASVPALAITEVVRDTALGAILLEHSYWDGKTLRMSATVDLERETWGDTLTAGSSVEVQDALIADAKDPQSVSGENHPDGHPAG
ncbi:TIGR02680 family protein [Chromatiales bacterium (ex Bugula neritina AB1)]|nr:TIGR02680 family protein [Chromatiales bacterium (ex Bugula neritina AB1)]